MEILSDGESSSELEIVEPSAGMEVEAASVAANEDAIAMEAEAREEVEEAEQE